MQNIHKNTILSLDIDRVQWYNSLYIWKNEVKE